MVPKASTGVPTQMKSDIPTCILLTIHCALKYHRTDQHYCCSHVLVSSLDSLCWLLILGNSDIWKTDCRGEEVESGGFSEEVQCVHLQLR